jgi:RNA polymerase sigma-70 factor, ECF subfamily
MPTEALNPVSFNVPQSVAQSVVQSVAQSRAPLAESEGQSAATPFDDIDSIVALHEQRIFRFLLVATRDADAAQSMTQDTFLRAWTSRASFRNECSVATWLLRIAHNLLRDHTRTERFRFWKRASTTSVDVSDPTIGLTHPGSSVESRLIASEQMALVWDTVAQLSARQRHVFILRFVEEMELSAIAIVTGLPISTVKSHLYRALGTIRSRHHNTMQESI